MATYKRTTIQIKNLEDATYHILTTKGNILSRAIATDDNELRAAFDTLSEVYEFLADLRDQEGR